MSSHVELILYGDAPPYDHGPGHPLRFGRVGLTSRLIRAYGLVDGRVVTERPARDATDDEIGLVHHADYIEAVKAAGAGRPGPWGRFGFGAGDNPVFARMHEATARAVGATLTAAESVLSGRAEHAFNPAGGLHHALPARASGFCVYNDPAIAIRWLLARGAARVAYVDVDVHHGDGPDRIFHDDPRVLTISLHQSGRTLFPGTGFVGENGTGDARATKVNVALPPYCGDDAWLAAFDAIVPPLVSAWGPDVLVTQLGCDTHCTDPLAHQRLTTAAYRQTAAALHDLAHRCAGGRWVATGGGGYQWAGVVPRAWAIYFAEMAGRPGLPDDLPHEWVAAAEAESGEPVPTTLSEPVPDARRADDEEVTAVIDEVRRAIFPARGLG